MLVSILCKAYPLESGEVEARIVLVGVSVECSEKKFVIGNLD